MAADGSATTGIPSSANVEGTDEGVGPRLGEASGARDGAVDTATADGLTVELGGAESVGSSGGEDVARDAAGGEAVLQAAAINVTTTDMTKRRAFIRPSDDRY